MKVTKRQDRSIPTALLQTTVRPFGSLISKPGKHLSAGSPRLDTDTCTAEVCHINERKVDDIWIYDVSANPASLKSGSEPRDGNLRKRRVYYIAGGSFCMPPSSDHWKFLAELSQTVPGVQISLLSPPLAPHSPAPLAYPEMLQLYKTLMTQSNEVDESVFFAGDSSGANLALSLVFSGLRDFPMVKGPKNILLISPVVDLSLTNPTIKELEEHDPVLRLQIEVDTAKSWAASWNLDDPRLSPIYAHLTKLREGAINVHGVVGTYDLLTPDAIRFRERCEEMGIGGHWLEWEKQMHCFPIAWHYHLPESIQGKDWIVDLLSQTFDSYE